MRPSRRRLASLLALVIGLSGLLGGAWAQLAPPAAEGEDKVEIVTSLWCDTPDQLEALLRAHYIEKIPIETAMAAINSLSPEACIPARAIAVMGKEVRRFSAGDNIFAVRSASIRGVMRGQVALMMRQQQTWYSARIVAELVPL